MAVRAAGKRKNKGPAMRAMSRRKVNRKARFVNTMLLILLLVFSGTFFAVIATLTEEREELLARIEDVNDSINEENLRTSRLEEKKIRSHTREFVEEKARETYGLLYDGEIIFINGDKD